MTPTPLIYYSVNTFLAYEINQRYYGGKHFVWCSPFFHAPDGVNPPSSNPRDLFLFYRKDVLDGDLHSSFIRQNRLGLLSGSKIQLKNKVITKAQAKDIEIIVNSATLNLFRPLIYLIPESKVRKIVKPAPIAKRAGVLSYEYIIEKLPRSCFDYIEI